MALGLVNRVVESAGLLDAALALAADIVSAPPSAIAAVKRNLGRVPPSDWDAVHNLLAYLSPAEWREGLTAFSEKRPPDYERFWAKSDADT
jgi:enoyl-CoA hydratase